MDRLPGNPKEDGGGGPPIGAGNIHGRQQHDGRRHVHRVSEREGQHDAHDQGQSGKHADQKTRDDSHDEENEIDRLQTTEKSDAKMTENIQHNDSLRYLMPSVFNRNSENCWNGPCPRGRET